MTIWLKINGFKKINDLDKIKMWLNLIDLKKLFEYN